MEGPLFVPFVWATITALTAAYDHFLNPIGPSDEAFEAFCASGPPLARIACEPGRAADVAARTERLVAKGIIAGRGAPPWSRYRFGVRVTVHRDDVHLAIASAKILRGRRAPPPDVFAIVRDLHADAEAALRHVVVRRELFSDGHVSVDPTRTWALRPDGRGGLVLSDVAGVLAPPT